MSMRPPGNVAFVPHSLSRRVYETIYMLHTGQGLWPLALILGLAALAVPGLSTAGAFIWWKRRAPCRAFGKMSEHSQPT